MIRGVLVDLDDTLLDNDMGRFLPAYFQRLGDSFAGQAGSAEVLQQLLRATRRMMENTDPLRTLKEVFDSAFYPALGTDVESVGGQVETFYRDAFPALRVLTSRRPAAVELVETARTLGLAIVIATNPLMPEPAVLHRLDWAGVPVGRYPFDLVTTYESFHFAKPNPAYFGEILGRMGWRPNEAVMIGNDPHDDLEPAAAVGIPVFHVGAGRDGGVPEGDLQAAAEWLRRLSTQGVEHAAPSPIGIQARLRGQMAALHHLTRYLGPKDWTWRPSSRTRSPVEIIGHLRDVEAEVTLPRIELIRRQANAFLPSPESAWVRDASYAQESGPSAFQKLADLRSQLLAELATLTSDDWARPARHALLGPTTLAEVLSTSAEHELVHLANLRGTVAAQPGG